MRWLLWCFCLLAESYETINHWPLNILEQQWRETCVANATRIRGSPLIIEQTNSRATISRVVFGVNGLKSAKSTATPVLKLGGHYVKSVDQYKYLGISLDTELSDSNDIKKQLRYQYCSANKLRASFSRCWNIVKNELLRSFCTPMYASQLWCNFRKSCIQRLRVAYNFGCRALYLYNLPWRASVSSHLVQCNIPTFEALLRKYKYLFLERCRKSSNLWLRALMQSDCLYSSLLFDHYNRILLCDWVIELCSVRLIVIEWSNFAVSVWQ